MMKEQLTTAQKQNEKQENMIPIRCPPNTELVVKISKTNMLHLACMFFKLLK